MRNFTIVLLLLLHYPGVAQVWCPSGAVWVYHYTGWGADVFEEHRYAADTLIGGSLAQMISVDVQGTQSGGLVVDDQYNSYTRTDTDVVLQWVGYDGVFQWDTLYRFGNIGDRWWPLFSPMNCPPDGMLQIVDTSSILNNGITLRRWSIVYLDALGQPASQPAYMTERIGSVPRIPHVFDCNVVIDYFFPALVCYSDSDQISIGWLPCVLDVAIHEPRAPQPAMRIAPNPCAGVVRFAVEGYPGPLRIEIIDRTGRTVLVDRSYLSGSDIDVGGLANGAYIAQCTLADRSVLRSVLCKQQ